MQDTKFKPFGVNSNEHFYFKFKCKKLERFMWREIIGIPFDDRLIIGDFSFTMALW